MARKRGVDINIGNISVGNYFLREIFRRFFRKWKSPLIGADNYWKLVRGEIKKDDDSGLVAINLSFGWSRRNEARETC